MNKEIGISAASKLLGVSISTLKRLCDENLVPSIRTPGGHRRFDRAEVVLVGQTLVGHAPSIAADHANLAATIQSLIANGDEQAVVSLIREQFAAGQSLAQILDHSYVPALKSLLSSSGTTLSRQHVYHRRSVRILDALSGDTERQFTGAPVAIGGAIGHWHDEVASKMVEVLLRTTRIHALHLQNHIELQHLAESAQALSVRCVWLAHFHGQSFEELIRQGKQLRQLLPKHISLFLVSCQPQPSSQTTELAHHTSFQRLYEREAAALKAGSMVYNTAL